MAHPLHDADRDDLVTLVRTRLRHSAGRIGRGQQGLWDINHLAHTRQLLPVMRRGLKALDLATTELEEAERIIDGCLRDEAWPDAGRAKRLGELFAGAAAQLPPESAAGPTQPVHPPRAEAPPITFWRRWAVPAHLIEPERIEPARAPASAEPPPALAAGPDLVAGASAAMLASPETPPADAGVTLPETRAIRICLLSPDAGESRALVEHLRRERFEVDMLRDPAALADLPAGTGPDVILIDRGFGDRLESIGELLAPIRARALVPPRVALISDSDAMLARLAARRAGVDGIIDRPQGVDDVVLRLCTMFNLGEPAYRVLIVEDDRSQAAFAEGILRNAGMETRIVLEAMAAPDAIREFQPDLVLMDHHMPVASGVEVAALIREHEEWLSLPIVFLTGEADPEVRFSALDAGGDDFLTKPIRPKHLVTSLSGRIRRYRHSQAMVNAAKTRAVAGPANGVLQRAQILRQIDAARTSEIGGIVFVELQQALRMREQLSARAFEHIQEEARQRLQLIAEDRPIARLSDGGFIILDTRMDPAALTVFAERLRNSLHQAPLQAGEQVLSQPAAAGVVPFAEKLSTVGALLNAAENMARDAHGQADGVMVFSPLDRAEAQRQAALIDDMRLAMVENRLSLLFQPIVAVAGGDESRYQTLLRLLTTDGRPMTAGEVIPAAERSGFIVEIDRWVIREALNRIAEAQRKGHPIRLFVTQSPNTLAHPNQLPWLAEQLQRRGIEAGSLVIELRLDDVMTHSGSLKDFCQQASALGIPFCLSQFESGTEADAVLDLLPLSLVKLSRKYSATTMATDLRDELRLLIEKAHRRNLEVVGHGVEDPQAAAVLWMSGVDFVQGNLVQQAGGGLDFDFHQSVL